MAAKTQGISTVWSRPQRQRRETPALSRDLIVAEAIELLDTEGLDALSMRRLGTKLNAGATSLYTHVANKEELIELAVDKVLGDVPIPDPDPQNWRDTVLIGLHGVRETILRHPWMTVVMSTSALNMLGPNMMRLSESMLEILESAGFDDDTVDLAANALFSHAVGTAGSEATILMTAARSGLSEQEWVDQFMAAAEEAARPYPRMHKRHVEYRGRDSAQFRDEAFDREIGLIMDGLELRLRTAEKR
ncbi:TetR/AcrR family transcriptional regulator [Nocardia transvalensis]|uniref:TetR/AcrR family transcriptional regulator n=1 Tax=Nocardia transvalensis TaxID=37333 RepID=UPI0018933949|nr:TetR/AcrR family transcriptional regulator [Nocardia transvalensis]MBF6333868.1 TetR/AcrR family transcriptional regulator C-terminal domain-containing protein [Nocardia transvalensis]